MLTMMTNPNATTLRRFTHLLLLGWLCSTGCGEPERNNPVDPHVREGRAAHNQATLSLAVPLPKVLATVVDSLVARLEVPDAPTVIKELQYDTPLGPALLTIGALSPGGGVTLTIEGYDLDGRLILSGTQTNITIAADDTTRISIDLRLAIDPDELDDGETDPAPDPGDGEDTTGGDGTDTGGTDPGDTGGDTSGDPGDTGDTTGGAGDGTGSDTSQDTGTGDTEAGGDGATGASGDGTGDTGSDTGDTGDGSGG